MIALQVEILTGHNAGRKLLLRQTCVTFGRSNDRTLPIDLPFASREHAEFLFDHGTWKLVNHSNNGTRLNGKLVTNKPRPIKDAATVTIGDTDAFRVTPIADGADQPTAQDTHDDAPAQQDATQSSAASRTKLWVGIGVFWAVAFGLMAFAFLNTSDTTNQTPGSSLPPIISADQIQTYLARPLPKQTPDPRQADTALAQAKEFYALIDRRDDALYRAYESYQRALAYIPQDAFQDPQDQRQFYVLQKRLTEGITQKYEAANALLNSRQYAAADQAFKNLRAFYPDPDSPIFRDALKREAAAREAIRASRR